MKISLRFFCLMAFIVLGQMAIAQTNYYIAPDGDDANAGTLAAPKKTLQAAINLLPNLQGNTIATVYTIYVRGGVYTSNTRVRMPQ